MRATMRHGVKSLLESLNMLVEGDEDVRALERAFRAAPSEAGVKKLLTAWARAGNEPDRDLLAAVFASREIRPILATFSERAVNGVIPRVRELIPRFISDAVRPLDWELVGADDAFEATLERGRPPTEHLQGTPPYLRLQNRGLRVDHNANSTSAIRLSAQSSIHAAADKILTRNTGLEWRRIIYGGHATVRTFSLPLGWELPVTIELIRQLVR